jgi:hypothetical protein
MGLLCKALDEIETRGESDELNLLLRDFARELLKQRLFARGGVRSVDLTRT